MDYIYIIVLVLLPKLVYPSIQHCISIHIASVVYTHLSNIIITYFSFAYLQVYWIGPVLGAILAGVSHEFFFARSASRQKLVACLTCKDIEIVETTSMTGSSLSTVTQNAMRAKQANKQENNWGHIHDKKNNNTYKNTFML